MPIHEQSFILSPETDARLQNALKEIGQLFPTGEIVGVERRLVSGIARCVIKVKV